MWLSKLFFNRNIVTAKLVRSIIFNPKYSERILVLDECLLVKITNLVFLPINVYKRPFFPLCPHWCSIIVCSVSLFRHHCGAGRVSASEAGAHTECRSPGPGVAISPHKHVTGHPGSHHTEKNNPPSKSTLVFLTFRKYVTRRLTLSCFHVRHQCGMLWLGNNREMFLIIWSTLIEKIGSGTGINPWI